MWKDDARLSVHMYGDEGNFILLSIKQEEGTMIGDNFSKCVSLPINDATPESIGEAFAKYLRENFWE